MSSSETVAAERPGVALDGASGPLEQGQEPSPPGFRAARRWVHLIFTCVLTVIGGFVGKRCGDWYVERMISFLAQPSSGQEAIPVETHLQDFSVYGMIVIGLGVGFLLASITFRKLIDLLDAVERLPLQDKIAGMIGIIFGLGLAYLMSPLVGQLPAFGRPMVAVLYIVGVFGGMLFTFSMKRELTGIFSWGGAQEPPKNARALPKLIDTNVIIDGRLLEILNAGFLEGELLVPQFVLDELQMLADKADDLVRARGRRGLDLLNRMKAEQPQFRTLAAKDYAGVLSGVETVDSKLLQLAVHLDAALLTNDSNLNRVADLQGVPVLNINRLALALKPAYIAGEELKVNVIKPGRDPGQGVAYLDDGTMVVVEDGEPKIGKVVEVVVTSLLQTVQGKMIFAELKDPGPRPSRGGNGR